MESPRIVRVLSKYHGDLELHGVDLTLPHTCPEAMDGPGHCFAAICSETLCVVQVALVVLLAPRRPMVVLMVN